MKKRLMLALAATAVLAGSIAAPAASAATEFGSGCTATGRFRGGEISVEHSGLNPLPTKAPASGVLTEWKVNVGNLELEAEEGTPVLFQELYVVRPAGTDHYLVVGKADSGTVSQNVTNYFKTRIPIQQGDLLGLGGPSTLYCATPETSDKTVDFRGLPPIGSIFEVNPKAPEAFEGFQVPVTAKIEPDVDGDGYGDETQDGCPQSAAYHEACPIVAIGTQPSVGAEAVNLSVTTSLTAPVTVSASVALGKGKVATLSAPGQTVSPGKIATFNLALTPQVEKTLKALKKSKALSVTITATAANITGAPSASVTTAKLRGHGAGAPKKHRTPKKHGPKK